MASTTSREAAQYFHSPWRLQPPSTGPSCGRQLTSSALRRGPSTTARLLQEAIPGQELACNRGSPASSQMSGESVPAPSDFVTNVHQCLCCCFIPNNRACILSSPHPKSLASSVGVNCCVSANSRDREMQDVFCMSCGRPCDNWNACLVAQGMLLARGKARGGTL